MHKRINTNPKVVRPLFLFNPGLFYDLNSGHIYAPEFRNPLENYPSRELLRHHYMKEVGTEVISDTSPADTQVTNTFVSHRTALVQLFTSRVLRCFVAFEKEKT